MDDLSKIALRLTGGKAVAKPTVDSPPTLNLDVFHKSTPEESVAAPFQKESIHATEFGCSGVCRCNEMAVPAHAGEESDERLPPIS
jgi:hypothetical protein